MRIIFMGTPDFSVSVLNALTKDHEIIAVYCQPPRPAGRGKKPRPSPVQTRAEELGLLVRHPVNFKTNEDRQALADLNADIAVVVAYGLLLPQAILDAPRLGCLNIHASLLPRWRGAAPIQRAIMAGDAQTGVCIMQMEAGLDTGPVLLREAIDISPSDTAGSLHDKLAVLGSTLIVDALSRLDALPPETQPDTGETYAKKIDKAEAKIDWTKPAAEIDRLIRGISPFPGAWFVLNGERVKALLCELADGTGPAGAALDDELLIACGLGAIRLTRVQKAGKGPQDAKTFLLGSKVPTATLLA